MRERAKEELREKVCVWEKDRQRACKRGQVCVCVCVCERERERERENERETWSGSLSPPKPAMLSRKYRVA